MDEQIPVASPWNRRGIALLIQQHKALGKDFFRTSRTLMTIRTILLWVIVLIVLPVLNVLSAESPYLLYFKGRQGWCLHRKQAAEYDFYSYLRV